MAISPDLLRKAAAAVGVAISVTTIPASAYLGVLLFTKNSEGAWGALGVLTTNLLCLLIGGTLTVVLQQSNRRRRGRAAATLPPDLC